MSMGKLGVSEETFPRGHEFVKNAPKNEVKFDFLEKNRTCVIYSVGNGLLVKHVAFDLRL